MNHIQRQNAEMFKRCQAAYDAKEHPDYYAPDPPSCHICGYECDQEREDKPICEECVKAWYTCPACGMKYDHKADKKNDACDDCKEEGWGEQ